ncbi:hypothetical protein [Parendozoicomonas haliclonae]|uniref:Uncharacterized protein n=1 Tax=Parendozoicomonas haliclonae TaxID=1960125 RepID=A0A1X7ARN6_9GAMM|nr:hypothetical protein [Parendozoicomonas haliclonae]SMA50981.1 hypothetical protein EHSB41UT_04804 [Parendozoicomonas haliclonae]
MNIELIQQQYAREFHAFCDGVKIGSIELPFLNFSYKFEGEICAERISLKTKGIFGWKKVILSIGAQIYAIEESSSGLTESHSRFSLDGVTMQLPKNEDVSISQHEQFSHNREFTLKDQTDLALGISLCVLNIIQSMHNKSITIGAAGA